MTKYVVQVKSWKSKEQVWIDFCDYKTENEATAMAEFMDKGAPFPNLVRVIKQEETKDETKDESY